MKKWIFLVGLALSLPVAAQAGDLSFYTGYLNPGGLGINNAFTGFQLRGSADYGGRFEIDFHRTFGIEQNIAFVPNLAHSGFFESDTNAHGFLYHSNLVMNLPMGHMVPFATAGIGLISPFGTNLKPFGTRFAFNYGGGLKFLQLWGPIGLRFDVRGYAVPDVAARTLNMVEASGGLVFSLGRD